MSGSTPCATYVILAKDVVSPPEAVHSLPRRVACKIDGYYSLWLNLRVVHSSGPGRSAYGRPNAVQALDNPQLNSPKKYRKKKFKK